MNAPTHALERRRWPERRILTSLGLAFALSASLAGCASGPSGAHAGTRQTLPVQFTLDSSFDETHGFRWVGRGGPVDGQYNPALKAAVGRPIRIVVRHSNDTQDAATHDVQIVDASGTILTMSREIKKPGSQATLDWRPSQAGSYRYECMYHPESQSGVLRV